MSNNDDLMQSSAEGTALSEANYLDTHYEAAKEAYEESARYVGFQKGWSILDAGAGGGSFIPLISGMLGVDGKITALDLDAENVAMIERRKAAGEFSCPVETHAGGVTDLPFDDNSFDAIWCSAVQQYLSDEEVLLMLAEFKRVVRPGGLIVVKDFDTSGQVVGMNVRRSRRFTEGYHDIPEFAEQAHGLERIFKIPSLFGKCGIQTDRYKTFTADYRFPVSPAAKPFLETMIEIGDWMVSQMKWSEEDTALWKVNNKLDSPNYYYREAHGVAIGRKPA